MLAGGRSFRCSSKAVTSAVDGCVFALRRKQSRAPLLKALFGRADVVWFKALEQNRNALAFKSARHVAWFLEVASFSAGPAMR